MNKISSSFTYHGTPLEDFDGADTAVAGFKGTPFVFYRQGYGYRLIQTDTDVYRLKQTDTDGYRRIHGYRRIQTDTDGYRRIQTDTD